MNPAARPATQPREPGPRWRFVVLAAAVLSIGIACIAAKHHDAPGATAAQPR